MPLDTVPWAVDGARTPAALARVVTYASTGGRTGISRPSDLRVTALPTPGDAVRIGPGSAVLENLYPGGAGQSYAVRNVGSTEVAVPATGSGGGATRYLIIRVDDPEFAGQIPADPLEGPYVRAVLVSSITNLAYPHIVLARINQPANTATITQSMIVNQRKMLRSESERALRVSPVSTAMNLTSTSWVDFPAEYENIVVPDWAVYAVATAEIGGMQQVGGAVAAEFSMYIDDVQGQLTAVDAPAPSSGYARNPGVLLKWESPVTPGSTIRVKTRAKKLSGAGYLRADNYTQIVYDLQFTQVPV